MSARRAGARNTPCRTGHVRAGSPGDGDTDGGCDGPCRREGQRRQLEVRGARIRVIVDEIGHELGPVEGHGDGGHRLGAREHGRQQDPCRVEEHACLVDAADREGLAPGDDRENSIAARDVHEVARCAEGDRRAEGRPRGVDAPRGEAGGRPPDDEPCRARRRRAHDACHVPAEDDAGRGEGLSHAPCFRLVPGGRRARRRGEEREGREQRCDGSAHGHVGCRRTRRIQDPRAPAAAHRRVTSSPPPSRCRPSCGRCACCRGPRQRTSALRPRRTPSSGGPS